MAIPSYPLGTDGVRVHALGHYLQAAGDHALRAHRHEFWQCVVFTGGEGRHDVDLVAHPFAPGSVLLLAEGAVHRFVPSIDDPTEGILIHFTRDFFVRSPQDAQRLLRLQTAAVDSPLRSHADEDEATLTHWVDTLKREAERVPADVELLRVLLHGLTLLFARWAPAQTNQPDYLRFLERVEVRYKEHDPVPAFARALQMSDKRLYAVTHEAVGLSPGRIIDRRLLLEAKRLLTHSDETVSAIGFGLGFREPAYFSRFFKQRAGESPRAFRQARAAFGTEGLG